MIADFVQGQGCWARDEKISGKATADQKRDKGHRAWDKGVSRSETEKGDAQHRGKDMTR